MSFVLAEFARFSVAILVAFAGMVLVKSRRRPALSWLVRTLAAFVLFGFALWIVYVTTPYPTTHQTVPAFTIVGSAVLIAGLAAEEFVGADIRRVLRM